MEIHSQNAHQKLLTPNYQRRILDDYAVKTTVDEKNLWDSRYLQNELEIKLEKMRFINKTTL